MNSCQNRLTLNIVVNELSLSLLYAGKSIITVENDLSKSKLIRYLRTQTLCGVSDFKITCFGRKH